MISSCFCFLGGFFPAGDLVVVVVVVVIPTRRISDGVVFEHLSTSNGVFAVEILQFCRFPSRRCQAQNVSFGTTRVFRVSLWEFAGVLRCFAFSLREFTNFSRSSRSCVLTHSHSVCFRCVHSIILRFRPLVCSCSRIRKMLTSV